MSVLRRSDGKARVILPHDFASQLLIIERVNNTELRIRKGRAVRERKYSFKQLVAGITMSNRHAEIDSGRPVGHEVLPPHAEEKRRARKSKENRLRS
jgi:antitoxin component of MazEF toxin-antitoxin module